MKKYIFGLIFILLSASAYAAFGGAVTLLLNTSTIGPGESVNYAALGKGMPMPNRWFQATLNGASAVSATVSVEGSTDNENWAQIVSAIDLTAASATKAVATVQTAPFIRGNLIAISGVGATVTLRSGQL
ncbi:hypothetical protein EPO05_06910 [Patescibacteria group bacterium]|nr:MAG: hypothetical protein EPO05_06910 [Patescibacteria group bacterium]